MEEQTLAAIRGHMLTAMEEIMLGDRVIPAYLQAAFGVDKKALLIRVMNELVEGLEK